ncbi:acyl-protein synthetase [Apiosordaria backusii]|uniref:Acyl-protein synthetase n=1 Tax=Apiosordaria backusii TaxID=314023 RepID=A0AA40AAE0_9PEZI|nr:acyl-protein synthetase [Apiosordaria backusii]
MRCCLGGGSSCRQSPCSHSSYVRAKAPNIEQLDTWECLQDVLKERAELDPPRHLLLYSLGSTSSSPKQVSYGMLYDDAKTNSLKLATLPSFEEGRPVLLHLEGHWDTIVWFWAVLLAGGIPVLSSPLSNVEEHRAKHLQELSRLLESPICITRAASLPLFEGSNHSLKLQTLETLPSSTEVPTRSTGRRKKDGTSRPSRTTSQNTTPAVLMLTSGSTGNAKAVRLTHRQILAAVAGKASVRPLPPDGAFLNWIGLDHVASLVEIHIQALWMGVDQVHVHAADVVASPRLFLDLLSKHRVSRSFAPNFFLAKLVATCSENDDATTSSSGAKKWDLSNLAVLASGGEANDVQTCVTASALLVQYGAPHNVITPGFGMTETCAGSIFNLNCPVYDVAKGRAIASLGRCMPGIQMRVVDSLTGFALARGEQGNLEVRGAVVFDGYYRNPAATSAAFTADGWFRTGDRAMIDEEGNLSLVGRAKDVINVNGAKIVTADIQASLEMALRHTCTARVVCFPSRALGAATEKITVAYVPQEWPPNAEEIAKVDALAVQACMMVSTASVPVVFSVGPQSQLLLPISSLGKISGAKMAAMFEAGKFDNDVEHHRQILREFQRSEQPPVHAGLSEHEIILRTDFAVVGGIDNPTTIRVDVPLFELGFTSMDLIRLKYRIDTRLGITVAVAVLLKHPTVRSLAAELRKLTEGRTTTDSKADKVSPSDNPPAPTETEYDPVVVLRSTGNKTPLWLVHPGVGEVLVFVGLAQHMRADDRPVYALRARGFEPGRVGFTSISEAVDTYVTAIRRRQPHGPYALAGYSYGAMLAFEAAKKLQSSSEEVRFLGSFNLPPHIKTRMRQLNWNTCLLNLSQFLGLVTEDCDDKDVHSAIGHDEALKRLLSIADSERMQELGLTAQALARWADVAYSLQSMAVEYEPSGSVACIDVFHAEPLRAAAPSRSEWVSKQLSRWGEFCQTEPRFHAVGGAHYTMLAPHHVASFAETLRMALADRGV